MKQSILLLALATTLAAVAVSPAQPTPTITIDAAAPRTPISPDLYGAFFEEINHAGDGGLYAELIRNRDFESNTLPPGWHIDGDTILNPAGWKIPKWFDTDLPGWSLVADGDAQGEIAQDSAAPLNGRNPHSLRLTVTRLGARCGVANSGYWGMNIQAGQWYDATFYARTQGNRHTGLIFSLESADGSKNYTRVTLPEVGGRWAKYSVSLHPRGSDPKARLVISPIDPTTIWLDTVSLFPRKTYTDRPNGMRVDLAQLLADLKPKFLRFPGGCVVEGATLQNRFRWSDSIGDISQRTGGLDLWGYYNTYGLGFAEYLQLTEDLGAQAVYVINSGTSCHAPTRRDADVATDADLPQYVQDSMDALEYALGDATTKWGARRVADGHADPFKIKYVEIGNENGGPNYLKHYKVFYDAIKAKYPAIITIADERLKDIPVEYVDDHFYETPERFFQMANYYDNASRAGPRVYVGEFAANRGVGQGNLLGALAEAVFILNLEKNSDLVKMCSYAPLFENVNERNWPVNLIRFDSSRAVGRSSYQIQKLIAANRPDVVLQTQVDAATETLTITAPLDDRPATQARIRRVDVSQVYALAGYDKTQNELVLKVINPTPAAVKADIALKGLTKLGAQADLITIGDPDVTAENTLDEPNRIVPAQSALPVPGARFQATFPANSLTVLRLAAQ